MGDRKLPSVHVPARVAHGKHSVRDALSELSAEGIEWLEQNDFAEYTVTRRGPILDLIRSKKRRVETE